MEKSKIDILAEELKEFYFDALVKNNGELAGYVKNIVDYNDHLGLITFITFICFVIVANMNCFIFNPSFSVPMFFLISLFIGAISCRLQYYQRFHI